MIIFDEATSSIDEFAEKNVMNAITKLDKNMTFIIVAHRLNTLKDADVLVRIDKGEIIDIVNDKNIRKLTNK